MEKNKQRKIKELAKIFAILLVLLIAFVGERYFSATHFLCNTRIEGVDCSFLSIEKAIDKVNLEKGNETVTFSFASGKTYNVPLQQLGIRVDETQMQKIFDQQHLDSKESREYQLDGFILTDEDMLKSVLEQIPEMQEENMIEPENACIILNEIEFSIQDEVWGNVINFDEAVNFTLEKIKSDEKEIDFSPITDKTPEILADNPELVAEKNELNSILKSSINFKLGDGSTVTLDENTIRNWISQDENGKFTIDVENGVAEFVKELAIKVEEANSKIQFAPTDCENLVAVNLSKKFRVYLEKEQEIAEIMSLLGNSEPIYKSPIYDKEFVFEKLTSYVEIDISRQNIWFYKDGELILDTPCVTGNVRDGNGTPTGVFYLLNKDRNASLDGFNNDGSPYHAVVEYWMRIYEGIGLHGAPWRSQFGGDIYLTSGSHGCINMPEWAAEIAYENIDETMPVIVYLSQS